MDEEHLRFLRWHSHETFPLIKAAAEEDDEEIVGDDWMKNSLKFEDNNPKMAKDANTKVKSSTGLKLMCHLKYYITRIRIDQH